jgi:DNA-binding beta-propeller fold protein YncE
MIYVATITSNGGPNLISVFNGETCNATTTAGCGQTPANAPTGNDGDGGSTESVAVNATTNTIYATSDTLGNPFVGHTVYVIDGPTCDAADTAGCPNPPEQISIGSDPVFGEANPFGIAVDQATDTIYTANIFNGEGPGTVSVINGATCNAHNASGCGQTPATAPAGFSANGLAVDPINNRVYATNIEDTSVTTINGNACNRSNKNGCDDTQTRPIVGRLPKLDQHRPPSQHRIRRRHRRRLSHATHPLTRLQVLLAAAAVPSAKPHLVLAKAVAHSTPDLTGTEHSPRLCIAARNGEAETRIRIDPGLARLPRRAGIARLSSSPATDPRCAGSAQGDREHATRRGSSPSSGIEKALLMATVPRPGRRNS